VSAISSAQRAFLYHGIKLPFVFPVVMGISWGGIFYWYGAGSRIAPWARGGFQMRYRYDVVNPVVLGQLQTICSSFAQRFRDAKGADALRDDLLLGYTGYGISITK
jgi:hypothetical protein